MAKIAEYRPHRQYGALFWGVVIACLLLGGVGYLTGSAAIYSGDLVINELLASNGSGLADEDGDFSDWIEIHNPSNAAVNLSGWSLTDDPQEPEKWTFPDLVIGSGEYLVVFASGKDRRSPNKEQSLHVFIDNTAVIKKS